MFEHVLIGVDGGPGGRDAVQLARMLAAPTARLAPVHVRSEQRSALVAGMCAVMASLYVAALLLPPTRTFFALTAPSPAVVATALVAGAVSIAAPALSGYWLHSEPAERSG
jgi:hypothetical protein